MPVNWKNSGILKSDLRNNYDDSILSIYPETLLSEEGTTWPLKASCKIVITYMENSA